MKMNRNRQIVSTTLSIAVMLTLSLNSAFGIHANDGPELVIVEKNDVGLSIKGSVMYVDGQADEYVYAGHGAGVPSDYKVSELNWDISSLWMVGGSGALQLGEYIRFNVGAWVGITDGDGGMKDYDWLDPNIPDWTHYSESEVDIEAAFSFDINASFKVFDLGACQIHGVVGNKHDFWEWSDMGGAYIYSTDSGFRDDIGSFGGGNGIDYEQSFDIMYAGLKLTASSDILTASAYAQYSPFVRAEDKDHHIYRNLYFTEDFEGGDYYAAGGELSINLTDTIFLAASVDYQIIPEFTGDLTVKEGTHGEKSTSKDAAGIGNELLAISASAGLRF